MGKKRANLSGLSAFAKSVFNDSNTPEPAKTNVPIPESPIKPSPNASRRKIDPNGSEHKQPERPPKKVKTGILGAGRQSYDASSLVPHYSNAANVPEHLQKYFAQRKRYFSLYDEGCLLDEEGWYSVTPERIAHQIAERCRCDTILDAFCGVGGNAIAFAKTCERVIALDTSPIRLALARHNAVIYGVADRIEFILADYISFAHSHLSRPQKGRPIDVVFLSPPWGGPSYLSPSAELLEKNEVNSTEDVTTEVSSHPEYSLSSIKPIHGAQLFHLSRKITSNVAYYLPRHTNLEEISSLLTSLGASDTEADPPQMVEVEEEWMGSKLKALTCYFGGLVSGQEHLF